MDLIVSQPAKASYYVMFVEFWTGVVLRREAFIPEVLTYLESQVAENNRLLYSKVAQHQQKAAFLLAPRIY